MTPLSSLYARLAMTLAAVIFVHENGEAHTTESSPLGQLSPRDRKQAPSQVRQGNTDLALAEKPTFLLNKQQFRAL